MTTFFSPQTIQVERKTSPARVYADGFLYEELGKILPKRDIDVLDVGCGSGYVRKIFHDAGYTTNYTGLDVVKHKDFDEYAKFAVNSEFIASQIETFTTDKKFDLILSMFALEHIENDTLAAEKMAGMLSSRGAQLHMAPSPWSFLLYLKHGHRRYTSGKLKKLFGGGQVYRIGGACSFAAHFLLITVMKRALKTTILYHSDLYPKILKVANRVDRLVPMFPIAYLIVVKEPKL